MGRKHVEWNLQYVIGFSFLRCFQQLCTSHFQISHPTAFCVTQGMLTVFFDSTFWVTSLEISSQVWFQVHDKPELQPRYFVFGFRDVGCV